MTMRPRRPPARARIPLAERLEQTRVTCLATLGEPPFSAVQESMKRQGFGERLITAVVASVKADAATAEFAALRDQVSADAGVVSDSGIFERTVLLRTVLENLGRIEMLPVDESVQHLFCRDFAFYAALDEDTKGFSLAKSSCIPRLRVALLKRFPAGQSEWEVSGFPRSWLKKVPLAQLPRVLAFFATKVKGFSPVYVGHLSTGRKSPFLLERSFRLAFYRSALAMAQQPEVIGNMAASWLHSRETHRVSPHLAFMNRPFMEAGGCYFELGPAKPSEGFLEGDPHRTALYEKGDYCPTTAVVLCSREQTLAWMEKNRELDAELEAGTV